MILFITPLLKLNYISTDGLLVLQAGAISQADGMKKSENQGGPIQSNHINGLKFV